MESAEAEPLQCDPHPSITVDTQADEKEHHVMMVTSETEALESDADPASAVGSTGLQAVGSEADGYWSASTHTEHLELEPNASVAIVGDAQAVGNEQNSSVEGSEGLYTYALASVSTLGLQPGESKHDETTIVSAEGVVHPDAVDVRAGRNQRDKTIMAAAETEAVDCTAADFEVFVEECTTDITLEAQNMQEKTTVSILENNDVSVISIKHLEQEVVTVTQSPNTVSNHEGSFNSVSPAGETEGDGTFEHIPIHNQEEIQGEEPVFDISEFDLGAHDVPITETFFDEHCMFPALDADKAETWQGSEDNVISMESSGEHGSDQPSNMDAIPVITSSDTIAYHGSAEKLVDEEKLVHGVPLQTSLESVPIDATHGCAGSSGANDSHVQGHEQVSGHQSNEADDEHVEGLAPVIVNGDMLPPEDSEGPDAHETHPQGNAEGTFVSYIENDIQVAQLQNMTTEDMQNTNYSAEEVEIKDDQLNESHRDAAVRSVNSPDRFSGLGVESNNSIAAANEEVLHSNTQATLVSSAVETFENCEEGMTQAFGNEEYQDTLVTSTVETFKSHEESITQASGNEENECVDSQLDENCQLKEKNAYEQSVEAEKDAYINEGDSSNLLEAACTSGSAELLCALPNSKQEEKILAVVQTSEISKEAALPVEEPLVQEEMTRCNKESTSEIVTLNDIVSQIDPVVSHMEVKKLHTEEVEKPMDDMEKSVQVSDGKVLDSRESDVKEIAEGRGEVVENKAEGLEAENEEINEQAKSCSKPPVDAEETVEDRNEVVEEKVVGADQENEELNEQGEYGQKPSVDTLPLQGRSIEEATQDLTAERIDIVKTVDGSDGNMLDGRKRDGEEAVEDRGEIVEDKVAGSKQQEKEINEQGVNPSYVKIVEVFDGNMLDGRQRDGEEAVEERGEIVKDKVAGSKQEEQEINEQRESSLQPPVDTWPFQAGIAEEAILMAERTNTGSSSDAETATSSCSDFTPVNDFLGGANNDEKHVLQSLKSVGEDSKGKSDVGSPAGADSLSKKQLQKHISYNKSRKSPMLEGGSKLDNNIVQAKEGDDADSDGCASDPEEEPSEGNVHKDFKEGNVFGIGDLVWAKVRSHPWWPAQIFDPADASKSARKAKKFGRVLVAFFGDRTFAWLQQSQMIAFRPHFKEKVKQTTVRIFCVAVEEALQEFCRRSELGLSCAHFKGSLHSTCSFPDANTGIREGVRVKRHKDFGSSVQMLRPDRTLEYMKGVACSPLGEWCSTLKFAELRGHVYGLRTCMVASGSFDSVPVLSTLDTVSSHGSKLKRPHSSLETNDDADGGGSTKVPKKMKNRGASDEKGLTQISKKPRKTIVGGQGSDVESKVAARKLEGAKERNKDNRTIKFKVSKKNRGYGISSAEGLPDTGPDQGVESEKSSDDGKETLLASVGSSHKALKRSSSKEDKNISSHKKKGHKQTVRESKIQTDSASPDSDAAASPRTEDNAEDAFAVTSSLSEEKVSKAKVKRRKDKKKAVKVPWSSAMSIDVEDLPEGTHRTKRSKSSKVWSGDEMEKTKFSKVLKEVERKKEGLGNDTEAGKRETVRKFSRVGDSIRKVAGELTGTVIGKSFDDTSAKSPRGPTIKLKLPASPTPIKAASKESTEDVDLLQLRQDLELLANKAGGGSRKAGKHVKKGDQAETVAEKASPQWQNVPHKTQKSCMQELALAARKRKSEIVHDEVSAKLPKDRSTTGPQGHHASKAYIKGVEKPAELRSVDKSVSYYSRRPASLDSNVKGGSSQRYDEKLSSHMPLGLFMRFPEDFPLPSESQLKAAFIPFGPLQMSATRLYHDSASAQVVFKHGRDAESAMRHAKKNPVFGPVAVTYRLRHLSHSLKVEAKSDTSSPSNISTPTPVRRSFVAKEKGSGSSAPPATRAGDKERGTSGLLTSINNGSEPTGDIQDQMMTLLRQVSVLVKPSPVGSDGT